MFASCAICTDKSEDLAFGCVHQVKKSFPYFRRNISSVLLYMLIANIYNSKACNDWIFFGLLPYVPAAHNHKDQAVLINNCSLILLKPNGIANIGRS